MDEDRHIYRRKRRPTWLTCPRHPDGGTDLGTSHDHGSTTGKRRWGTTLAVMLGVGVAVLVVVVLHLTGTVGPGAH